MRILLVDDNTDYLRLLKDALVASGYDVCVGEDGIEGCETLTGTDIDLIISDIRMPRLDGMKLHSFARNSHRYKKIKFVFLSAFKDVYRNIPGLDSGIDFFLDKTAPIDAIVEMVDRLVFGNFAGKWV